MTEHVIEALRSGPGQIKLSLPGGPVEVDAVAGHDRAYMVIESGQAPQVDDSGEALIVSAGQTGPTVGQSINISGISGPGGVVGSVQLTGVVAGSIKIGGVDFTPRGPETTEPVSAKLRVPEGQVVTVSAGGPVSTRGRLALAQVDVTGAQAGIDIDHADKADLSSRGDITVASAGRLYAESTFGGVTAKRMDRGTVEANKDIHVEHLSGHTILRSTFGSVFAHVSAPIKLDVNASRDITVMCDPGVQLLDESQLRSTFGKVTFLTTQSGQGADPRHLDDLAAAAGPHTSSSGPAHEGSRHEPERGGPSPNIGPDVQPNEGPSMGS